MEENLNLRKLAVHFATPCCFVANRRKLVVFFATDVVSQLRKLDRNNLHATVRQCAPASDIFLFLYFFLLAVYPRILC